MITSNDLKKRLQDNISQITPGDTQKIMELIGENLKYGQENYDNLSEDGKKLVDEQFELIGQLNDIAAEQMELQPDSLKKRQFLRLYRKTKNSHFGINWLLGLLNSPNKNPEELDDESKELFYFIAQVILDYLADITAASLKSTDVALLGLFFSALDEIVVAYHLAEHHYAPQSINHSRVVLEILDKIKLFLIDPSQVSLWADADNGTYRKEFMPGAVRKKLGNQKGYDDTYNWLSELGAHSTFRYIQSKVTQNKVSHEDKKMTVGINVGGSSVKEDQTNAYVTSIYVAGLIVIALESVYGTRLLTEEVQSNLAKMKEMSRKYYIKLGIEPK